MPVPVWFGLIFLLFLRPGLPVFAMTALHPPRTLSPAVASIIAELQEIIGTDAGDRGMASLVVPGDLVDAASVLADFDEPSTMLILSGFPCCIQHVPPTETDGPPGAVAIARAVLALGHTAIIVTDDCNQKVFQAAMEGTGAELVTFPPVLNEDDQARLDDLKEKCDAVIACERAGPAADGNCYTMRGIHMKDIIAPIHTLATERREHVPFVAIGDGGNELGMGKVIDEILSNPKIQDPQKIACVVVADYLIAASVSNWGGYALAAAMATAKAHGPDEELLTKCLPSREDEIQLLDRCVAEGCRDGVSGENEATVDGMPLETSLQCLEDIRKAAMGGK